MTSRHLAALSKPKAPVAERCWRINPGSLRFNVSLAGNYTHARRPHRAVQWAAHMRPHPTPSPTRFLTFGRLIAPPDACFSARADMRSAGSSKAQNCSKAMRPVSPAGHLSLGVGVVS